MTRQIKMSWNRFDTAVRNLAAKIKKSGKVSSVYGEARGGLVVAVRLSHLLDVPLIQNLSYADKNTIIVDDIIDSGWTMLPHHKYWRIAVLYFNPTSKIDEELVSPTFYIYEKPKNSWIVFPWEKK